MEKDNSNQPRKINENYEQWIKARNILGSLAVILTPFVYLMGVYSDSSYLAAFNASDELYPREISFYWKSSYEVITTKLFFNIMNNFEFKHLLYIWLGATFVSLTIGIIVYFLPVNSSENIGNIKSNYIEKKNKNISYFVIMLIAPFVSIFAIVASFVLISILFFMFSSMGVNYGSAKAKEIIEVNVDCSLESSCTVLNYKNNIVEGMFIAKSNKYIAIWDGDNLISYPLINGIPKIVHPAPIIKKPK